MFACHVVLLDILEIQRDATLAKIQMLEQISRDSAAQHRAYEWDA